MPTIYKAKVSIASMSIAIAAVAIACSSSGDDKVSRADCQRLRAHQVELRLQKVAENTKGARGQAELEKHRANLREAGGEKFLDHCVETRSSAWMDCALDAPSFDAIEKCSE